MLQIGEKYENCINKVSNIMSKDGAIYLAVIIYKLLLDIIYYYMIGNQNAFFYIEVSSLNIMSGWIFVLTMPICIKSFYKQEQPSSILLTIWYMIYFIPITTYCAFGGGSSAFLFFSFIYCVILSFLQLKFPIIVWKKSKGEISGKGINIIIGLVSVILIYIWARYTNFRILLTITDVYEVRAEAAGYSMPIALSYFISLAPILIALIMLYALANKKKIILLWSLVLMLISFSYAGHKTVLFMPVILIGGYVFYRKGALSLLLPVGILAQIAGIIGYLNGNLFIVSLLFRRGAMMLAQLSESYYRFFENHNIDLFRNSFMGKLGFDSIWDMPISKVIGNNFKTQVINSNNGFMADVWANLGLIGLFVMPIILIVCLRLLDFAAHKLDIRIVIGLVIFFAFVFANSSWSTALISHGFLLTCIVLFLFPKYEVGNL